MERDIVSDIRDLWELVGNITTILSKVAKDPNYDVYAITPNMCSVIHSIDMVLDWALRARVVIGTMMNLNP